MQLAMPVNENKKEKGQSDDQRLYVYIHYYIYT